MYNCHGHLRVAKRELPRDLAEEFDKVPERAEHDNLTTGCLDDLEDLLEPFGATAVAPDSVRIIGEARADLQELRHLYAFVRRGDFFVLDLGGELVEHFF